MTSTEIAQRNFEAQAAYEAWHRKEIASNVGNVAVGSTLLANFVMPGLFDAIPQPNTEYREKAATNEYSYSRDLGSTALAREIMVSEAAPLDYEAEVISLGYARRSELSAEAA